MTAVLEVMNKLIEQIDKLINKKGSLKTPAYYIRGLFIDIVNYFENKINSFNTTINNINKKINTININYLTKEEGQNIKTDIDNDITNLNSSLLSQINLVSEDYFKQVINQISDIYFINNYYNNKKFVYLTSSILKYTPNLRVGSTEIFNFELYFGTLIPVNSYIKVGNLSNDSFYYNNDDPLVGHYTKSLNPDNIDDWFQKDIVIKYTPKNVANVPQKTCKTFKIVSFIYFKFDNFSKVIYVIEESGFVWEYKIDRPITYITLNESSKSYGDVKTRYKYTLDGVELDFTNTNTIQLENFKVGSILKIENA